MYKWHVNSAIGRGRPLTNDLARVADGIAASLRQFSISAQRCADQDAPPQLSRTQRSASAVKEVSSLAPQRPPHSKGIDARSLAAKPPGQTFTIRRVDMGSSSSAFPRSPSPFRGRGGSTGFRGRGGPRGGARGGARGRGTGLRGRNARGPRAKKPKHAEEIDYEISPFDETEEADYNLITGGIEADYNPITSLESLRGWGPGVITSQQGMRESVVKRLGTAMDRKAPAWESKRWHREKLRVSGLTAFKDEAERRLVQGSDELGLGGRAVGVDEATRERLNKEWIAGHYEKPGVVDRKDVLGLVGAYARKNQGYLAEDTRQFEQDVASLLPASLQKGVPKAPKRA